MGLLKLLLISLFGLIFLHNYIKEISFIKAYGVIYYGLGPIEEIKHLQSLNRALHLTFRLRKKILIGAQHFIDIAWSCAFVIYSLIGSNIFNLFTALKASL